MAAVVLKGYGGLEMLEFRSDVPVPEASPGEVLLRVGAAGINNTDIWTREGAYGLESDNGSSGRRSGWRRGEEFVFPRIQGADIAGQIVAVGPEVPESRIGERVLVNPTLYAPDGDELDFEGFIGSERDGGFAEFVAVPSVNAHAIQSTLSDAELATFPTAYLTAEHMLNRARLASGETVLVTGASGGVGSALVQLAKTRGANVVAITSQGKKEALLSLGADIVIGRPHDAYHKSMQRMLGSRKIAVVADVVGGPMALAILRLLEEHGRYVTAGAIAGPIIQLDLRTVYLKQLTILGSTLGTQREFGDLVNYITSGVLKPLLAKRYSLADIALAQSEFLEKRFVGKLVLIP